MILRIFFTVDKEPELMLFENNSDLKLACLILDKTSTRWEFV